MPPKGVGTKHQKPSKSITACDSAIFAGCVFCQKQPKMLNHDSKSGQKSGQMLFIFPTYEATGSLFFSITKNTETWDVFFLTAESTWK